MAKLAKPLSDVEVKNTKPRETEFVLCDIDGLRLRVQPNGIKTWLFHYKSLQTKKRTNLSIGKYPILSLSDARKITREYRQLLAQDIDPQVHIQKAKEAETDKYLNTFAKVAERWFEVKKDNVTPNYAEDIWRSFDLHVFEKLGHIAVSDITAPMVIQILRPLEAKGSLETVKRLIQRINEVMTYAVNSGVIFSNPLSGIGDVFKKPKKENMLALRPDELSELMQAVSNASIKITTRSLIEWQLHTMTRPSEAAGTRWDELDLENKIWTIPADRMKKRRAHRIPLTDQMIGILDAIRFVSGGREFVFPSDRDPKTHCNNQTANMALKRMGFANRLVSHGLRSLASTTLNEQGFDHDLVEAALSHVDDNQVRSAYNRTDYLERRRPMMEWWSKHIEQAAQGSLSISGHKHLVIVGR